MMSDDEGFRVAAAVHSVRAVPAEELDVVVEAAVGEDGMPRPLHVHVSEQPAENEACQSAYGCSPTELLSEHGVLGSATTAVHATHVERTRHRAARRVGDCRVRLPDDRARPR